MADELRIDTALYGPEGWAGWGIFVGDWVHAIDGKTMGDQKDNAERLRAGLDAAIARAVAAETERCARVAEAEPEYPDASEEQHPHVVALIREHPVVAAQAIAADVKKSIARAIRVPTSGAAAGGES